MAKAKESEYVFKPYAHRALGRTMYWANKELGQNEHSTVAFLKSKNYMQKVVNNVAIPETLKLKDAYILTVLYIYRGMGITALADARINHWLTVANQLYSTTRAEEYSKMMEIVANPSYSPRNLVTLKMLNKPLDVLIMSSDTGFEFLSHEKTTQGQFNASIFVITTISLYAQKYGMGVKYADLLPILRSSKYTVDRAFIWLGTNNKLQYLEDGTTFVAQVVISEM